MSNRNHPFRRAMRQQQIHVRSHGTSHPIGIGNQLVQWAEDGPWSYFYRPMDFVSTRRNFRYAHDVLLRMAADWRRKGKYNQARSHVNSARWLRMNPEGTV